MLNKEKAHSHAVEAEGNGLAKAIEAQEDSTSFEELARQYAEVERRYFGDVSVGLI